MGHSLDFSFSRPHTYKAVRGQYGLLRLAGPQEKSPLDFFLVAILRWLPQVYRPLLADGFEQIFLDFSTGSKMYF
jgi:hypothetical protein